MLTNYTLTAALAYLLGSLPTGYLLARAKGVDIRQAGSGNIGATNVFRILGKGPGIFVLTVDALKGWLACVWLAPACFPVSPAEGGSADLPQIVAGVAAILGHNYTCWLRFKGGKGIATSAGVLLAWVPVAFGWTLLTWLAVFAVSRYVSLASITAAFLLPFAVWLNHGTPTLVGISTGLGVLAIYKHRANIRRLLDGTENRVGRRKSDSPKPA